MVKLKSGGKESRISAMYKERRQNSTTNTGEIVSTHATLLKVNDATRNGFPDFDPGLDGMQLVLCGMNIKNRLTSIIPVVLTNLEMDEAKRDLRGFNKICKQIEDNYSTELLKTTV